ncbi:MAG: YtxH domain-containing protein, partial [Bacteroidales bacterium]
MLMTINEFIGYVIAFLGGGALTGVINLIMLKPKKESALIENLKVVIDEVKEHYNDYKVESENKLQSYKNDVEVRLNELESKVNRLELKNTFLQQCVNLSYRCEHAPKGTKCPVAEKSDSICNAIIEVGEDFNRGK